MKRPHYYELYTPQATLDISKRYDLLIGCFTHGFAECGVRTIFEVKNCAITSNGVWTSEDGTTGSDQEIEFYREAV